MVLIVKKFVKVFRPGADVPARFKNLRKNKYVKTFLKPYPTIPNYLVDEHGLNWDDKIIVFHVKRIQRGNWQNYRTPFKKIYYGTVRDFSGYLKGFLRRMRKA